MRLARRQPQGGSHLTHPPAERARHALTGETAKHLTLGLQRHAQPATELLAEAPGEREASSWDALLLGLGAGSVLRTRRLGGLRCYDGRFAGEDGTIEDLSRD